MGLFKHILSKEDLAAIAQAIGETEARTSGEIRVVLRHSRHWNEMKLSMHEIALREFVHLGMEKTKHRTGVLIMLLLSKKKFQIIADEGIHSRVEDGTWDKIAELLSGHFRKGNFRAGLIEAVKDVGEVLAKHFPRNADDTNQLSNDVVEE
ncbi:MAG TPA: TPM domain-containing protein [Bacteroidota bacterium]|nr:TPM domain-containing protein [Bacteroidota bacterium]